MEAGATAPQKEHRASRKKKTTTSKKKHAIAKPGAFARRIHISADRGEKRAANPNHPIDKTNDAAPRLITVVGPAGVGKSTIIRNLVNHYTRRKIPSITGPVTLVANRKKRFTFLEVPHDLPSMLDAAKVADLVLLVVDASFGFEMETFEFLNAAATHGMPRIITILTHLDKFREGKQVRHAKKELKDRIWAELYDGAKVFYLSGITTTGDYLKREILNLARFISVSKPSVLSWRVDHPYLLADRVEDITPATTPTHANRSVAAYGYIRGTALRATGGQWRVHLAGVADLVATNVELLADPCPTPDQESQSTKRRVSEREKILYAPMATQVDGVSYDRDAVYINLPGEVRFSQREDLQPETEGEQLPSDESDGEGERMVKSLQTSSVTVDERMKHAKLKLVSDGANIVSDKFVEGGKRRKIFFDQDDEQGGEGSGSDTSSQSGSDGEESDSDDDNSPRDAKNGETQDDDQSGSSESDDEGSSDSDSESEDLDDEEVAAKRWKEKMLDNAAARLRVAVSPSNALTKYVYGKKDRSAEKENDAEGTSAGASSDSESEQDNEEETFFTPRRRRVSGSKPGPASSVFPNSVLDDITRLVPDMAKDWVSNEALCAQLKSRRFGTGQVSRGDGEEEGNEDNDEPIDGDFEDLETGEVHQAKGRSKSRDEAEDEDDLGSDIEAIRERKIRQKEKFDAEWDQNGSRRKSGDGEGDDDDEQNGRSDQPDTSSRKAKRDAFEREPDPRKVERDRLEKLRAEEIGNLDAETRMALEGIVPGQYVRLELQDVPVEFVKFFDPKYPVVVGGLKASDDEGKTFIRARIRRHRFKRGVLKSSDPVVFSVGWRRFQSIPVYDTEDQGGRRRFLKYTPEYLHCNATFWAPSVAPGAGVVMCQSLGRERAGFRIAGTGVVTEISSSFNVVKKLKLIGEPVKVYKNTAFIKGMFNSELEASKYIGAALRTVSGIRGTVKKIISEITQRGGKDREIARAPAGTFRAGFEDKVLLSDIVFLRSWVPVEPPKFCSIATTLLDKERDGNGTWRMRTIREVRQAKGMAIPLNKDSLYKPIERTAPHLPSLIIPKSLEGALPYSAKPKQIAPKKKKLQSDRKKAMIAERAVVMDAKERKEERLMQAVYSIRKERNQKRDKAKQRQREKRKKEIAREEAKHAATSAANRKRRFALEGAAEARASKRGKGGDADD